MFTRTLFPFSFLLKKIYLEKVVCPILKRVAVKCKANLVSKLNVPLFGLLCVCAIIGDAVGPLLVFNWNQRYHRRKLQGHCRITYSRMRRINKMYRCIQCQIYYQNIYRCKHKWSWKTFQRTSQIVAFLKCHLDFPSTVLCFVFMCTTCVCLSIF